MIDTDKYEGHTEGKWEYVDATIHATAKGGNEIIAEYPCWNYNKDQLITEEEKANLRLMADAPILLAEVKRLREVNDDLICELQGFQEAVKEDEASYKDLVASLEGIEEELKAEVKRLRERVATLESLMEYMADEEKVIE